MGFLGGIAFESVSVCANVMQMRRTQRWDLLSRGGCAPLAQTRNVAVAKSHDEHNKDMQRTKVLACVLASSGPSSKSLYLYQIKGVHEYICLPSYVTVACKVSLCHGMSVMTLSPV